MGRKPGSLNRKTRLLMPMLEALGHRDPAVVLSEIASMPELKLRKWCKTEAGRQALAARIKAAAELMPYCHGKMPVQLNITPLLPEFNIFGNTNQLQQLSDGAIEHVAQPHVVHSADLFETIEQFDDKPAD